jgi:hypothetical protein
VTEKPSEVSAPPEALCAGPNQLVAFPAGAPPRTIVKQPLSKPGWHTSSNALFIVVYNSSRVTTVLITVEDNDGGVRGGGWATRQSFSGAQQVAVDARARASFIFDGGVGPAGSRLSFSNVSELGAKGGFDLRVTAWLI